MKHSKQKGNLGFSSTLKELHKLGLNVFTELGDNSRIDLIVEVSRSLVTLQVKYATEKPNSVILPLRKCGPNGYRYTYVKEDIDVFSVYLPVKDKTIFIPAKLACQNASSFTVRFEESKNHQTNGIHTIQEFENLEKILNDVLKLRNASVTQR